MILSKTGTSAFGLLLVVLSLPSALPVPAPGYSTPFGIALLFLGGQMFLGKKQPWFPQKLLDKQISFNPNNGIFKKIQSFMRFFTKIIQTRFTVLFTSFWYRVYGALIALGGISMILPIPLTNTPPAFGIFLLGMSMIEEDGLFAFLGSCALITGILLTLSILIFGVAAVKAGIGYVF